MTDAATPISAPGEVIDKEAMFWWHMDQHADTCDAIARSLLQAEGATDQEISEIYEAPEAWWRARSEHFDEWEKHRQKIAPDYNALNDKHPDVTMQALNSRAASHTILAIQLLKLFRVAREKRDVMESSAGLLNVWNHLFVTTNELSKGAETFAVVVAPAIVGQKGGKAKSDADPKHAAKVFVYECWKDWRVHKVTSYPSSSAFAKDMLDKQPVLESQQVIQKWCTKWQRGGPAP